MSQDFLYAPIDIEYLLQTINLQVLAKELPQPNFDLLFLLVQVTAQVMEPVSHYIPPSADGVTPVVVPPLPSTPGLYGVRARKGVPVVGAGTVSTNWQRICLPFANTQSNAAEETFIRDNPCGRSLARKTSPSHRSTTAAINQYIDEMLLANPTCRRSTVVKLPHVYQAIVFHLCCYRYIYFRLGHFTSHFTSTYAEFRRFRIEQSDANLVLDNPLILTVHVQYGTPEPGIRPNMLSVFEKAISFGLTQERKSATSKKARFGRKLMMLDPEITWAESVAFFDIDMKKGDYLKDGRGILDDDILNCIQ